MKRRHNRNVEVLEWSDRLVLCWGRRASCVLRVVRDQLPIASREVIRLFAVRRVLLISRCRNEAAGAAERHAVRRKRFPGPWKILAAFKCHPTPVTSVPNGQTPVASLRPRFCSCPGDPAMHRVRHRPSGRMALGYEVPQHAHEIVVPPRIEADDRTDRHAGKYAL